MLWLLLVLGFMVFCGVAATLMRPKMRDPRLDRTWGGKPGKYDSPAQRYRR